MGRTLHYEFIPKSGQFSHTELEKLYNVGAIYYERCNWTCEAISIRPYDVYPSWENNSTWDKLSNRWHELELQDKHPNQIAQILVKEKIANFQQNKPPKPCFGCFTKTGGNELNSLQVVMCLLAASRIVKNSLIKVHDEGELLKCGLIISEGKSRPDIDEISSSIAHCLGSVLFNPEYESCKDSLIEHARQRYEIKEQFYQLDLSEKFEDISLFVRPINPDDFADYPEYNAAQIMAGFNGEYFGLSNTDPETKSYRMIASFQKLLPSDVEIKVCPKIK